MIVLNKGTSIFSQGVRGDVTKAQPDGRVVNVQFMLGANEVKDDDWAKCKEHGVVQYLVGQGTLVEQDSRPLSKRSEKLAVALVSQTFDPDLLAKWHEDDARPVVRKAIADQMKTCTLTDEDRKALTGDKDGD
jgi:hypothetical protein